MFVLFLMRLKSLFSLLVLVVVMSYCGPQSRKLSRITGSPVDIKLPEDAVQVISVSIASDTENKNQVKNVTYIDKEGHLITREFTDWGFLEGSIRWVRHDGSPYAQGLR